MIKNNVEEMCGPSRVLRCSLRRGRGSFGDRAVAQAEVRHILQDISANVILPITARMTLNIRAQHAGRIDDLEYWACVIISSTWCN